MAVAAVTTGVGSTHEEPRRSNETDQKAQADRRSSPEPEDHLQTDEPLRCSIRSLSGRTPTSVSFVGVEELVIAVRTTPPLLKTGWTSSQVELDQQIREIWFNIHSLATQFQTPELVDGILRRFPRAHTLSLKLRLEGLQKQKLFNRPLRWDQIEAIVSFSNQHRNDELLDHYPVSQTHLPRTVLSGDGRTYLLLTKRKRGDVAIGSGASKIIKLCIKVENLCLFALSTASSKRMQLIGSHEIHMMERISLHRAEFIRENGNDGLLELHDWYIHEQLHTDEDLIRGRPPPNERVYMVMEYANGGDLSRALQSPMLSEQQKLQIAIDLAVGLVNLSQLKIVHQDVKPGNIVLFLSPDSKRIDAKLCDFGCAVDDTDDEETKSEVQGSLQYMAPERAANMKNIDRGAGWSQQISPKGDIWALGLTFVQLFRKDTRALLPFQTMLNLREAIIALTDETITQMLVDESLGLNWEMQLLTKAMLKINPDSRIRAEEVLERLRRIASAYGGGLEQKSERARGGGGLEQKSARTRGGLEEDGS